MTYPPEPNSPAIECFCHACVVCMSTADYLDYYHDGKSVTLFVDGAEYFITSTIKFCPSCYMPHDAVNHPPSKVGYTQCPYCTKTWSATLIEVDPSKVVELW